MVSALFDIFDLSAIQNSSLIVSNDILSRLRLYFYICYRMCWPENLIRREHMVQMYHLVQSECSYCWERLLWAYHSAVGILISLVYDKPKNEKCQNNDPTLKQRFSTITALNLKLSLPS